MKRFLVLFLLILMINPLVYSQVKELRFGWPYDKADVEALCKYLSEELKIPVTIVPIRDYKAAKSKMLNDSIDFCYLSSFGYILATTDESFKPALLTCLGDDKGQPVTYQSIVFSSKASGINSSADLKAKAAETDISFVSASSTSGHLIPRVYLNSLGFDQAEAQFRNISFSGTHEATLQAVATNQAQLGASTPNGLKSSISKNLIPEGSVNVLWTSGAIPHGPFVASSKLDAATKAKLITALINCAKNSPETYTEYKKRSSMARNSAQIIEGKDEYYSALRQLTNSMEEFLQMLMTFYLE